MLQTVRVIKTDNPENGYNDKDKLLKDVVQHREDVSSVMDMISEHLQDIGMEHDWTKIAYFDDFARDTLERQDTPDFKDREWYNIHTEYERHHINSRIPVDVDLFDVLECIVDCIVAGKTRSGTVNHDFLILPQSVINNAYWNTVKKIEDSVVVSEKKIN